MSKSLISRFTAPILVLASITCGYPAQADEAPSLTYAAFQETQNYKDFLADSESSATYLNSQTGAAFRVEFSQIRNDLNTVVSSIDIESTKTATKFTSQAGSETANFTYVNGVMYTPMDTFKRLYGPPNIKKVIARIPGSTGKTVKFISVPYVLTPYTSEALMGTDETNVGKILSGSFPQTLTLFKCTNVTKSSGSLDPTTTNYSWRCELDLGGNTLSFTNNYTFDLNKLLTLASITYETTGPTGSTNTTATLITTLKADVTIVPPANGTILNETQVLSVSNQIIAEGEALGLSKTLVAKAKSLASKAKKPLSQKYLLDAAKALKISATKVTNGVKISFTVESSKANACIVIYKAKESTKIC